MPLNEIDSEVTSVLYPNSWLPGKLSRDEYDVMSPDSQRELINCILGYIQQHRSDVSTTIQALDVRRTKLLKTSKNVSIFSIFTSVLSSVLTFALVFLHLLELEAWTGIGWLIGAALASLLGAAVHIFRFSQKYSERIVRFTSLISYGYEVRDEFSLQTNAVCPGNRLPESQQPHHFLYSRLFDLADGFIPEKQKYLEEVLLLSNIDEQAPT